MVKELISEDEAVLRVFFTRSWHVPDPDKDASLERRAQLQRLQAVAEQSTWKPTYSQLVTCTGIRPLGWSSNQDVSEFLPLFEITAAEERSETGSKTGNIMLRIVDPATFGVDRGADRP